MLINKITKVKYDVNCIVMVTTVQFCLPKNIQMIQTLIKDKIYCSIVYVKILEKTIREKNKIIFIQFMKTSVYWQQEYYQNLN